MVRDDAAGQTGRRAWRAAVPDVRIVLVATLAGRLAIESLAQRFVCPRPDYAGAHTRQEDQR